jgi:uncharacterized protein (DUF2384 family)
MSDLPAAPGERHPVSIELVELLSELYEPAEIEVWLKTPQLLLDGSRPLDLIKAGRESEVISVLRSLLEGTYT